jgi:glycosyltransferase involved in cell wall biosynthesis
MASKSEKLNLAFVHASLPSDWRAKEGGVTYFVHKLANKLVERGHKLTVFSLDKAPPDALYRVETINAAHWLHNNHLARYYLTPVLFARRSFKEFQLVHAHGDDWLLRPGVPHLRTFYGAALAEAHNSTSRLRRLNHYLLYQTELLTARNADRVVVISDDTLRYFPRADCIIPCGVDIELFKPKFNTKSKIPSILFVGTMTGRKRGELLLRIFNIEIKPQLPSAQLWIVGQGSEEFPGVHFMGKVSQPRLVELYQQAWVFCLPSTYEGFGIPYLEALASGTPLVATPNPGALEITANGKYGLITEETRLGAELLKLLQDNERRSKLARLGQVRAKEYSWENIAGQYETLYLDMLAKSGKEKALAFSSINERKN